VAIFFVPLQLKGFIKIKLLKEGSIRKLAFFDLDNKVLFEQNFVKTNMVNY
jgi:hypothetical protein